MGINQRRFCFLRCQQGIGRAFREQEEILFQFLLCAPGAFEVGGNDFVDIVAVHMGPFEEHAGTADDSLDVRGKLIEFLLAVVQAPGDGFVDFDPGVIFCGTVELLDFPDEGVQGTGCRRKAFDVCCDKGIQCLVDQGVRCVDKDLLPDLGEDSGIPVFGKAGVDGLDGGEDTPGFFHVHCVYAPPAERWIVFAAVLFYVSVFTGTGLWGAAFGKLEGHSGSASGRLRASRL